MQKKKSDVSAKLMLNYHSDERYLIFFLKINPCRS